MRRNLLEPAEKFILNHPRLKGIDRDDLVRQTTVYLINEYDCSQHTGGLFAAQAIANIQSKGVDAYIDIDNSTSTCLFVCLSGQLRVFSITDLIKYIEIREGESCSVIPQIH